MALAVAMWPDIRTPDQREADGHIDRHAREEMEDERGRPLSGAELDLMAAMDSWIEERHARKRSSDDLLAELVALLPSLWRRMEGTK